jgi:SAM-dependent methyltransferase
MDSMHRQSATSIRALVSERALPPTAFRAALTNVPSLDRDAWLDAVLGLDAIPEDGADLPRGCIPYLPCPVDTLLGAAEHAEIGPSDLFVDVGSGVGRAAVLMHLLTGASAVGLEIQRELVTASRALTTRLNLDSFSVLEGDAVQLAGSVTTGTVFFLYCPFGGQHLEKVLDDLEPIARAKPIRVCTVNLPLPPRPWLALEHATSGDLSVYRSALRDGARASAG